MGYENDPYRDEDGEPLMDYGEDINPDNAEQPQDHHLLDDEVADDEGCRRERSPALAHNESKSKPRKRLVKKSAASVSGPEEFHLRHEDNDRNPGRVGVGVYLKDESGSGGKKGKGKGLGKENDVDENGKGQKKKVRKLGYANATAAEKLGDREMKEMWETVAEGTSEDDKEGVRTVDDDNFLDDSGVDPDDDYGHERDHYPRSPSDAPQAEEDEEIKQLFKVGKKKKKKKREKSAGEIAILVENVMAELELVAEEDAEINRRNKPAINKLKKLPFLIEVLSKKQLQQEFLDHGVLTLLKTWLEPLPDGSLPNINIRAAILKILTDYPIDLEQNDRREQLKKSNLGKVIMFLSKSDEETPANRKLAKDLVDKWSRPIFNKSTRFEDMRNFEDERATGLKRPTVRRPISRDAGMDSEDDDLDLAEVSMRSKSGQSSDRLHASRPEALAMDFVVRPQSKIDPEEVRARAKQLVQDQRRLKMNKKLQQLKTSKKKQLQATRLSIEGRGMVKYL